MTSDIQPILDEVDKILNNLADRTFELSQGNLIEANKVDTGHLLKTANIQRDFLSKTITYPAPYAAAVHNGRAAGHPMYSEWLHKWVTRKLGISNKTEMKSVAFAIARSIEARGIDPFPFLEDAYREACIDMGFDLT